MTKYRIDQIKLGLDEDEKGLKKKIERKLGRKANSNRIGDVHVLKKSIDARGDQVKFVYSFAFEYDGRLPLPEFIEEKYSIPRLDKEAVWETAEGPERPVVIGFGPCGMFAALVLARAGLKPIVLERGSDVDARIAKVTEFWKTGKLDAECNVQFGEGGAGTFSDGKLNTRIKDPRIRFVLETFVEAGADAGILVDGRPHIGTDVLRTVVKNIREEIIRLGGDIRFDTKAENLVFEENTVKGVLISGNHKGQEEILRTDNVVLAIGHSARDTFRMLYDRGIFLEPKAFSMGVRVQHAQELIDRGLYGKDAGNPKLPPAYYKLATRAGDGRGVYSFCMCPGGEIVNAASEEGGVVTNGMSNHHRNSGFANSGILVDVRPEDYSSEAAGDYPLELSGVKFQEKYERLAFENGGGDYSLPETTWEVFKKSEKDVVSKSLPEFVSKDIKEAMPIFGRKIKGFDNDDTVIKAIESRSSSPIRILRDKDSLMGFEKSGGETLMIKGLYPGGEGAGYAGGITSAACDGIKIAEAIIKSYLPSE